MRIGGSDAGGPGIRDEPDPREPDQHGGMDDSQAFSPCSAPIASRAPAAASRLPATGKPLRIGAEAPRCWAALSGGDLTCRTN
jgi:hypothetical protein